MLDYDPRSVLGFGLLRGDGVNTRCTLDPNLETATVKLRSPYTPRKGKDMAGIDDPKDEAVARLLVQMGYKHQNIAALLGCNQGRIAEVALSVLVYTPKKKKAK